MLNRVLQIDGRIQDYADGQAAEDEREERRHHEGEFDRRRPLIADKEIACASRVIVYSSRIQLVAEIEDAPRRPMTEKPGKIGE